MRPTNGNRLYAALNLYETSFTTILPINGFNLPLWDFRTNGTGIPPFPPSAPRTVNQTKKQNGGPTVLRIDLPRVTDSLP